MSAAPDGSDERVDRLHVDEALGRIRSGGDAVFITEDGDEIAAVISLDEYRRYREFRDWEDEIDRTESQALLDDPETEWEPWSEVRERLRRAKTER